MDDHLNSPRRYPPVNDPIVNEPLVTDTRPRLDDDLERDGSLWPFLALAALLLAGLLFIGNLADKPSTQIGLNTERPAITTQPPTPSPPVPQ